MHRLLLGGCLLALTACGGGSSRSETPPPTGGNNNNPPSGLSSRPDNASCVATISQTDTLSLATVFPNLTRHAALLGLHQAPDSSDWFYAVHQSGLVYRFANQPNVSNKSVFLDLSARVRHSGESGLLGVAFHPSYQQNRYLYVYYTGSTPLTSYLERYTAQSDFASVDINSRKVILTVPQPYSNHNGGQIAFGPDGFLYIGLGDGGSGGDPDNNGQNIFTLLGSVLRLDVNTETEPYRVPTDNPFVGVSGLDEIFAYGLRNPWRFSFDRASGNLWLADVGQSAREEINIVRRGDNLGWNIMEGSQCFNGNCNTSGLTLPVFDYPTSEGCSVTGGFVYRGTAIAGLQGQYLFSDFCAGTVWRLSQDSSQVWQRSTIAASGGSPAAFGEDRDGEIYVLLYDGTIKKLTGVSSTPVTPASKLSETGCVVANQTTQAAPGLIPYSVNVPFWSDGADKQRFLGLPNNTTMQIDADGDLLLPPGSVLMKHFSLAGQIFETRLLMHHGSHWQGYSYRWQSDGLDAHLQSTALETTVQGQTWLFPSAAQCQSCHTGVEQQSLGLTLAQLNKSLQYPSTQIIANQLDTLNHIGVFSAALTTAQRAALLPDISNNALPISDRARAYLEVNCANCHQPGGPTPSAMDLRYQTPLAQMQTCDVSPAAGDLGIGNARLVAPGAPERSILLARLQRLDQHRMPPLGSYRVDPLGQQLIRDWILSLSGC